MSRYLRACLEIDKIHWKDFNYEEFEGNFYPAEMLYSLRMVETLNQFNPGASELLKIAARCQHFKRWEIPRDKYPMDKIGYLRWRKELYVYQSEEAAKLLKNVGFENDFVNEFKSVVQKKNLKGNPNAQIIEDVACLVFIKFHLEEFSKKHPHEKMLSIIAKTWKKMSSGAKDFALKIELPEELKGLVVEAVS